MACRVVPNRHGRLALSLHWRGRRSWEGTGLPDTLENRTRLQVAFADPITAEVRAGRFTPERYLHYFPRGSRATEFRAPDPTASQEPRPVTVGAYFDVWILRQRPPLVRPAQERDYRQHLEHYVLPAIVGTGHDASPFRDVPLVAVTPSHVETLRARLLELGLSIKTARNILDASLRAMLRDARTVDQLLTTDPCAALRWPRLRRPKPDPFTPCERDTLLAHLCERRRADYPLAFVLFHTGMRPSEAVALRWGDVDTTRGTITIARSRYLGSEAATKTRASERTIPVLPDVRDVLRDLKPLHVAPEAYIFTNARGGPIDQREWPRDRWHAALRACGLRPRKFYATRHTFISAALTAGLNVKFIAEYTGTSLAMIEQHYGRFLEAEAGAQLRLLGAFGGAKTSTSSRGLTVGARNYATQGTSPTGFEPVLPA